MRKVVVLVATLVAIAGSNLVLASNGTLPTVPRVSVDSN